MDNFRGISLWSITCVQGHVYDTEYEVVNGGRKEGLIAKEKVRAYLSAILLVYI